MTPLFGSYVHRSVVIPALFFPNNTVNGPNSNSKYCTDYQGVHRKFRSPQGEYGLRWVKQGELVALYKRMDESPWADVPGFAILRVLTETELAKYPPTVSAE
jgi:hypothetical protein